MKILVVNYGSIGKRHTRNVKSLGHDVVLLRHSKENPNNEGLKEYYSFEDAVKNEEFSGAIVCSPTSNHFNDVQQLVKHNIPFLLEKPPTAELDTTLQMEKLLKDNNFVKYDVAFNLRQYPALQYIKEFLPNLGKIYSAHIYTGYFLPYWRKNIDYRESSSAKKELGGGVHIELVHEIDYTLWFFGCPEKVFGYVNKISNLEISTEDICSAIFKYKDGSIVELHLDYLSHKYLRGCRIIAENGTLEWDMNTGKVFYVEENTKPPKEIFSIDENYDLNETYIKELKNFFGIINDEKKSNVTMSQAAEVMKALEAIKKSSKEGKWIHLKDL